MYEIFFLILFLVHHLKIQLYDFIWDIGKYGIFWSVIQSWLENCPKSVELIYMTKKEKDFCVSESEQESTKFQTHVKC